MFTAPKLPDAELQFVEGDLAERSNSSVSLSTEQSIQVGTGASGGRNYLYGDAVRYGCVTLDRVGGVHELSVDGPSKCRCHSIA